MRRSKVLPRPVVRFFFWLLLAVLMLSAPTAYANSAALAWLGTQLQPDGSYAAPDGIATAPQATAETLRAQQALAAPSSDRTASLNFLDTAAVNPATEYLARTLAAHNAAGGASPTLRASLEGNQNTDGGFGGASGQTSNALDTAYALEALAQDPSSQTKVLAAGVGYLLSQQHPDGSYTQNRYAHGANYTTAAALMALHSLRLRYDVAQPITNAITFLRSARTAQGDWGSTFETAWALLALLPATTDTAPFADAAQTLKNAQLTDGSWGGDVYLTALAARALQTGGGVGATPWNAAVTGYAVDRNSGLPLAGVQVSADSGQSTVSGADGSFLIQGLPPGTHSVNLALAGYGGASRTFAANAGQQANIGSVGITVSGDVGILSGLVTDADNRPLAGVTVQLSDGSSAVTDPSGAYRLAVAPGTTTATLSAPGFLDAIAHLTISAGGTMILSPRLTEATGTAPTTASLYGAVVDADTGQALTGADIAVSGGALRTVADAAGLFGFTGLQPGTWELDVSLAGYQAAHITATVPAGAANIGTVRLPSLSGTKGSGIVTGTVTDTASGNPIAGAQVSLSGSATAVAVTNALGVYRIQVPSGTVSLTASAAGHLDATATATLGSGVTLTFSPGLLAGSATPPTQATLIGTVVDADTGRALPGVSVAASGGSPNTVTDTAGQFLLSGLTPGAWLLDMNLVGYQGLRLSLTAAAGTSDLGTIRLPAGSVGNTLAGIVSDSQTGQPLVGAYVAIMGGGQNTHTAADGSYRLSGITANQFSVAVSAVGYLSRQGAVNLAQPGLSTLDIGLSRAAGAEIDIGSVVLGQTVYPAHSKIEADIQLLNSTTADRKVRLYGIITDSNGHSVEEFPARTVPLGGNPADALEAVAANATLATDIEWHNGATAPGLYHFTVQAFDGSAGQLLAEQSVPFEITATQAVGGSAEFDPPITQLAAQAPIHLTAKISNRGNLDLAGGTVTAKVSLKNAGYQSTNSILDIQTLAEGNGLANLRGMDKDAAGNFYTVNYGSGTLLKVNAAGTVTQVASGFSTPIDVDIAPNGDIYVLISGGYERLTVNGSRQKFLTNLFGQNAIEVLADGRIFISVSSTSSNNGATNNVYSIIGASKTLLPIIGLSKLADIESDTQGNLYIGDSAQGIIFKLTGSNTLEIVQTGLPSLIKFAIDDTGTIAAIYNNTQLAFFAQDGSSRSEVSNTLPRYVYGLTWSAEHTLGAAVAYGSTLYKDSVLKLYPSISPASGNSGIGQTVYSRTLTLPALGLGGAAVPLDFGSWTPTLGGDFQADITVDGHPEYGTVSNTLHVGPNAHGDITVSQPTVLPGNQSNQATIQLFGAETTHITHIDPSGITQIGSSGTYQGIMGIVSDTQGNLYGSFYNGSSSSILKITPDGKTSVFLSGYSLGVGLAIDNQNNLYAHPNLGTDTGTVLKITPNGTVTQFASVGHFIRGITIGPDGLLYTVDVGNVLSRIYPDGRVEVVTQNGISSAYGLTIDSNGYFYIPTSNTAQHTDEDGVMRSYNIILRVSPDGKRYSAYFTQAKFEHEGISVMADCSNNLLLAPMLDYPFKTFNDEEQTLLEVVGDTGEEHQVLYGPSYDPTLTDIDIINYDRFGQRLLIWSERGGKIFSFPLICGGINADVHLVTRSDVDVSALTPAPAQSTDLGNGSFEHVWHLSQVDNKGMNLQFNLLLKGLTENESRPIAQDAYIEFNNSFVPGQNVRTPLAIPNVRASTAVQVQPSLDASQYGPMSPVNITVNVSNNGGQAFSGQVRLSVTDAGGLPVQDLPPVTVTAQAGKTTVAYPALWDTGLFLTGSYQLQAQLLNGSGTVVANGAAPFAITQTPGTASLADTLNPDKLLYGGWDQVSLDGSVSNTAANALLAPTVMTVSVTAPDGTVVYTGAANIGGLAVGNGQAAHFAFALADAASGTYTVAVKVTTTNGTVLDSFNKTFSVVHTAQQGLTGAVTATPNPVEIGKPATCTDTASNASANTVGSLTLTSLLVSLDQGTVIAQDSRSLSLAGGQTDSHARTIDTSTLTPGTYACVLRATVDGADKDLASGVFRADAPQITLSGHVFHDLNHDQTQTADEPGTAADGVWVTALNQGKAIATAAVQADGSYQLTVPGFADYGLVIAPSANATAPALPLGWSNTAELLGGSADAAIDGQLALSTRITAISGLNFGVDGAPSAIANNSAVTNQGVAVTLPVLANAWPGVGATQLLPTGIDLNPDTDSLDSFVTVPGEGSFKALADGRISFTPLPGFSGVSSIRYNVRDNLAQATPTALITVTVTGPANPGGDTAANLPHANADSGRTFSANPVTVDVLGNDVAGAGADLLAAAPDLNPATPGVDNSQTTPSGLWQSNGDGTVTFTPASPYSGLAQLSYAVTDSLGHTASSTLTVSVSGNLAFAEDDSGAILAGTPIVLAVSDNDHPGGGQTLQAGSLDVDPSTPQLELDMDTAAGHWAAQSDGTLTFTPAATYTGTASLGYALTDSSGAVITAKVTIAVLPTQAPTATDDSVTAAFNSPAVVYPAANDQAGTGLVVDPATLDLLPATDAVDTTVTTSQGHWQVQADGGLSFTPALNQVGGISPLAYLIRDSLGQSATASVMANVAPPSAVTVAGVVFQDLNHDQQQSNSEPGSNAGGLLSVTVVAANATLVTSVPVAADGSFQVSVPPLATYTLVLSANTDGTASLPTGWRFIGDSQAGSADAAADGRLAVQVGVTAVSNVGFAIDGLPPVANDDRITTPYATPITVNLLANDVAGVGSNGLDPATLDLNPGTAATDSQFSVAGQGVYSRQSDGTVRFTPDPAFSGLSHLSYQVQDTLHRASNNAALTVAVGPHAVNDSLSTVAGTAVSGNLAINDLIPPGAAYTLQTAPQHGTAAVAANGGATYTPANGYSGTDSFSYQACSPTPDTGLCATASVAVTVTAVTTPNPISLETALTVGTRGRLLVLADPLDTHCQSHNGENEDDENDDDEEETNGHHSGSDDDDENDDGDHNQASCQAQQAERAYLEAVLHGGGWSYTLTDNADSYTRALRSGLYSLHALLSAQVKLSESVQQELREAVNHGFGLVVGGDHDQRNNVLDSVLGLQYVGHSVAYGLHIPAAPGYSPGDDRFSAACPTNQVRPLTATVFAQFTDSRRKTGDCAVTVQTYGRGKAAYLSFDLLAQAAVQEPSGSGPLSQLLLAVLDDVNPATAYRQSDAVPVLLRLRNTGATAVQGWLGLSFSGGAVVTDPDGGSLQNDGSLRWIYNLAAGASTGHQVWARLPLAGTARAQAYVHADGSLAEPYAAPALALPITDSPALSGALTQLATLSKTNKAYLPAYQAAQRANTALAKGDTVTARAELLNTANALLKISGGTAADLRQAIDEALRRLGPFS